MPPKPTKQSSKLNESIALAQRLADTLDHTLQALDRRGPDGWTKTLIISNVLLAAFTLVYVLLTYNMFGEMRTQSELAQRTLAETLKPQVMMFLDSLRFHTKPVNGLSANTFTAHVRIQNDGNTPAELAFESIDVFPLDRHQLNGRDSLLSSSVNTIVVSETLGSTPKFVPPHSSINFVIAIPDIPGRTWHDGRFYIHYILIFKDIFNLYHDVYSVMQLDLDLSHYELGVHNPAYSFHDYTEAEMQVVSRKLDAVASKHH
jgi:hypothetical protein